MKLRLVIIGCVFALLMGACAEKPKQEVVPINISVDGQEEARETVEKIISEDEPKAAPPIASESEAEEEVEEPEASEVQDVETEDKQPKLAKAYLKIPGTSIDDWVLWANDNNYLLRKDNNENYSFYGCYYLDEDALVAPVSKNVVIYGHNMSDNPKDIKFSQLLNYNNQAFVEKNQNIYLNTPNGTKIYKVVTAFYTDTNYNYIDTTAINIEEIKARSLFTAAPYTANENFITLSTCTYKYGQREDQRYVLIGREMRPSETLETLHPVIKNPKPKEPEFDVEAVPTEAATPTFRTDLYK